MFLPILAVLVPVAIYCWVLAAINRRERPTLVAGTWDCIGMLLAVSGILLVVGPALLTRLFRGFQAAIPPDQEFEPEAHQWQMLWWLAWGFYFATLIIGVSLMLWWRRSRTVIYNVDVELFPQVLNDVLNSASVAAARRDNHFFLTGRPPDHEPKGLIVVESFPAMSNVSLRWRNMPVDLRVGIERALARALDEDTRALDNPAANWFLAMTGVMLGMLFLTGMVWILLTYFPRR